MFGMRQSFPRTVAGEQEKFNREGIFSTLAFGYELEGLDFDQLVDYVGRNDVSALANDKQSIVRQACRNLGVSLEQVQQVAAQKQRFNPQPWFTL